MIGNNFVRAGLRTGLRPTMAARPTMLARPVVPSQQAAQGMMTKRMYSEADRGGLGRGKSKLIFRFGWRDIPIELYPMGFVVLAGVVGATIAITRHFYLDGLRLGPTPKRE
ncbi:hypothetical protein BCR39DRAFT_556701 [Naematelia encephala]|uniref:Uncharacterized protein n=1 Tax=Naematelia encephala TaxID=71784 RepID=A0A1Y2BIB2_9TREE|nr:hypothetical protein BCR39DRAFT_556701 [Naematelia encephala]